MPRLGWACFAEVLLLLVPQARANSEGLFSSRRRSLQLLVNGDAVLNGVLNLFTEEGVTACEGSCKSAFAAAFGVEESAIGCLCPTDEDTTTEGDAGRLRRRRRNLRRHSSSQQEKEQEQLDSLPFYDASQPENSNSMDRKRLRRLAEELGSVAFSARVPGGIQGAAEAIDMLAESSWIAVALAFGISESELEITTLTVTPPASTNTTETLAVISDFYDASDIPIVTWGGGDTDWAGGGRGVALFLAMLVLVVLTCCCCGVLTLGLLWKAKRDGMSEKFDRAIKGPSSYLSRHKVNDDDILRRSDPHSSSGVSADGSMFGLADHQGSSAFPAKGAAGVSRAAAFTHAGDEAAGGAGGSGDSNRAPVASAPYTSSGDGNPDFGKGRISPADASGAAAEVSRSNSLYGVTPYSRSTNDPTAEVTPGRNRFSTFLGNATPSRLRRLAGRIASRSPAMSGGSRRSKRSSGGSSKGSRRHRRQGSFPGAYSQRNSSELDHQRPPADPVYTFMIKTIAAKGFKFMTTTEIAFCAMRMYSHFRRTEGNYKRLTVMQNAENVPPVYEIIWQCDETSDVNPEGESRFFSSTSGTDAEQQKSLLACLLALSWDGSSSTRRTLQKALTPTRPSRVPSPDEIFWDEFKDNTDALSGDDEMVVVARVVLLIAGSSNKPDNQDAGYSSETSSARLGGGGSGGRDAGAVAVDHGDIMQALSGAHLREVGIAIKEARRGWQEAHVQLVSVLLVMAFLEEGAKNTLPGGTRPDPLSSLEWVTMLTPEALDAFLVEKLEARRTLVELDLEPSGLVIKQDEDGMVERVEPAVAEQSDKPHKAGSPWVTRGQQVLPKTSGSRGHRRNHSLESVSTQSSTKPAPVVITTVPGRKDRGGGGSSSGTPGGVSSTSASSAFGSASGDRRSLRTIQQQRPKSYSATVSSSASGGGGGGDGVPPKLTIDTDDFAPRVPAQGSSVRSELSRGLSPTGSQASSVVTRVYAPSSVDDQPQGRAAWAIGGPGGKQELNASPTNESSMSQSSVAASNFLTSPPFRQSRGQSTNSVATGVSADTAAASTAAYFTKPGFGDDADSLAAASSVADVAGAAGVVAARTGMSENHGARAGPRSPSEFSESGGSVAGLSDAASRYDGSLSVTRGGSSSRLAIHTPFSPNSAAGSRFDNSSLSSAVTRVGLCSPTSTGVAGRGGAGSGPLTGRSMASSMRSDGGSSFFRSGDGSLRSADSSRRGRVRSASASSWDEEDLQNMGTRWLADRAYNQQFDEEK